jgi:hypothetical protein
VLFEEGVKRGFGIEARPSGQAYESILIILRIQEFGFYLSQWVIIQPLIEVFTKPVVDNLRKAINSSAR